MKAVHGGFDTLGVGDDFWAIPNARVRGWAWSGMRSSPPLMVRHFRWRTAQVAWAAVAILIGYGTADAPVWIKIGNSGDG